MLLGYIRRYEYVIVTMRNSLSYLYQYYEINGKEDPITLQIPNS